MSEGFLGTLGFGLGTRRTSRIGLRSRIGERLLSLLQCGLSTERKSSLRAGGQRADRRIRSLQGTRSRLSGSGERFGQLLHFGLLLSLGFHTRLSGQRILCLLHFSNGPRHIALNELFGSLHRGRLGGRRCFGDGGIP